MQKINDVLDFGYAFVWDVAPHAHGVDYEVAHALASSALQVPQWTQTLFVQVVRG
jgi:hypothetical protein